AVPTADLSSPVACMISVRVLFPARIACKTRSWLGLRAPLGLGPGFIAVPPSPLAGRGRGWSLVDTVAAVLWRLLCLAVKLPECAGFLGPLLYFLGFLSSDGRLPSFEFFHEQLRAHRASVD